MGGWLRQFLDCEAPTHKQLDLTQDITPMDNYDLIIHAAAYTDVPKAEVEKKLCYQTNVLGTLRLLEATKGIPFVYISTEYIYEPTCFYTRTKIEAEKMVYAFHPHLIIRTLFKPWPFPHPKAFIDQWTKGDYVDVIAPMIVGEILRWEGKMSQVVDVGTEKKTMFELAKQSRPDVKPCLLADIKEVRLPIGKNLPERAPQWAMTGRAV